MRKIFRNVGLVLFAFVFLPLVMVTAQVGDLLWEQFCAGEAVLTPQEGGVLVSCFSIPTPTPTPTQPPGDIDPYPDAPLCAEHDDRAFHTLWNSELGCHYNHPHGDNPHEVDDIFGTQIYDWAGGEISYPWQTFGSLGFENDVKHQGYFWVVRRVADGDPCINIYGDGCIKAFRAESHFLMNNHDGRLRYHSYQFEALICLESNPDECGIMRLGGWQDTGDLYVDNVLIIDEPTPLTRSPRPVKLHGSGPYTAWYPVSAFGRVSVAVEDSWGAIMLNDNDPFFFCYGQLGCELNNSEIQPHIISVEIGFREYTSDGVLRLLTPYLDPDGNGIADVSLFTDRYGRILVDGNAQPVLDCEIGLDCIPLVFENVHLDWAAVNFQAGGGFREYDIYFNGEPSGWIEYFGPLH